MEFEESGGDGDGDGESWGAGSVRKCMVSGTRLLEYNVSRKSRLEDQSLSGIEVVSSRSIAAFTYSFIWLCVCEGSTTAVENRVRSSLAVFVSLSWSKFSRSTRQPAPMCISPEDPGPFATLMNLLLCLEASADE